MDLIRDINKSAQEKEVVELAIEETEPKKDTGKTVSDYLTDIQQEETN